MIQNNLKNIIQIAYDDLSSVTLISAAGSWVEGQNNFKIFITGTTVINVVREFIVPSQRPIFSTYHPPTLKTVIKRTIAAASCAGVVAFALKLDSKVTFVFTSIMSVVFYYGVPEQNRKPTNTFFFLSYFAYGVSYLLHIPTVTKTSAVAGVMIVLVSPLFQDEKKQKFNYSLPTGKVKITFMKDPTDDPKEKPYSLPPPSGDPKPPSDQRYDRKKWLKNGHPPK